MKYEKIISQSNHWYNDGLKKARERDLSGAIQSLRRSLQYYSGNGKARNLLGLVYYGRGEVTEALVEWIICRDVTPANGESQEAMADYYIQSIQNSAAELEIINHAIRRFNQCLHYCEQGAEDIATMQLKKVVSSHPSFLKAWQLLALVYMHAGQYGKAKQALKSARKIDLKDEITLRYIHELNNFRKANRRGWGQRGTTHEYKQGNEVIIQPRVSLSREVAGRIQFFNLIIGGIIGAAVIWFLVAPAIIQTRTEQATRQYVEFAELIHSLRATISAQTRTLDEFRAMEGEMEVTTVIAARTQESYENVLQVSAMRNSGNYTDMVLANYLFEVNRESLGIRGQEFYDLLAQFILPNAVHQRIFHGVEAFYVGNFLTAIDHLEIAVEIGEELREDEIHPDDFYRAVLYLGRAYRGSGNLVAAEEILQRVVDEHPNTWQADSARAILGELGETGTE